MAYDENKSRLLNDFFDGELSGSEEQEFFGEMATDSQLQSRLKNMTEIRGVIRDNMVSMAPPAQLTNSVFDSVGISIASSPKPVYWHNFKKYLQPAVIAILALWLLWMYAGKEPVKLVEQNQIASTEYSKPDFSINIPLVTSESEDIIENNSANSNFTQSANNPSSSNPIQSAVKREITNLESSSPQFSPKTEFLNTASEYPPQNPSSQVPFHSPFYGNKLGFFAELRAGGNWHDRNPKISPKQSSIFNGAILGVYYALDENFAIGAEIRNENFYHEFRVMDNSGLYVNYALQPEYNSVGLNLRGKFDLGNYVYPFTQVSVSANEIGPIGRVMAGFEYSPYEPLSFIFGVEYSRMYFEMYGERFSSGRFNISYGVSFGF